MAGRILAEECCVGRHSKLIIDRAKPTGWTAVYRITGPVGATAGGSGFIASCKIPNKHIGYSYAPKMMNRNKMLNIVGHIPCHLLQRPLKSKCCLAYGRKIRGDGRGWRVGGGRCKSRSHRGGWSSRGRYSCWLTHRRIELILIDFKIIGGAVWITMCQRIQWQFQGW